MPQGGENSPFFVFLAIKKCATEAAHRKMHSSIAATQMISIQKIVYESEHALLPKVRMHTIFCKYSFVSHLYCTTLFLKSKYPKQKKIAEHSSPCHILKPFL